MKYFAFPKGARLLKQADFRRVYKNGKRFAGRYFAVFCLRAEDVGEAPRIGITVTKAVGKAHERNYIKRHVREAFRLNRPLFGQGWFVVKARMGARGVEGADLRRDLLDIVSRIK